MTEQKPGCIHPGDPEGCIGGFLRLALAVAVVVVLVLAVTGCSKPTGQHWPRTSGNETLVNLVVPLEAPSDIRTAADRAARDWSAAEHVRVRMITQAQPAQNNVVVLVDGSLPEGHGLTAWSYDESLHIRSATIRIGSAGTVLPSRTTRMAACHEVGHALGLVHGVGEGPCESGGQYPHPTAWDLALVDRAYGHVDPAP